MFPRCRSFLSIKHEQKAKIAVHFPTVKLFPYRDFMYTSYMPSFLIKSAKAAAFFLLLPKMAYKFSPGLSFFVSKKKSRCFFPLFLGRKLCLKFQPPIYRAMGQGDWIWHPIFFLAPMKIRPVSNLYLKKP